MKTSLLMLGGILLGVIGALVFMALRIWDRWR